MHAVTYAEAQKNFGAVIDRVCADREPTIITRMRGRAVVLVALGDYEAMEQIVKRSGDADCNRLDVNSPRSTA